MRNEIIRRIMTENPKCLEASDFLIKAVDYFKTETFHHLPVVEENRVVGMHSVTDLLIYLQNHSLLDASKTQLREVMSTDVKCIYIQSDLRTASQLLCSGKFHSLPVVGHNNELLGIITSSDLIQHMLSLMPKGDGSLNPVNIATLQSRLKLLEEVRMAAELFLRTGHREHAHSVLLEKLSAAQNQNVHL